MRTAFALLLSTLALIAAGCGGDDGGGDGGGLSIADGKQKLVDSCHKGHEGDAKDLALCRCTADELQAKHGYDEGDRFDDARKKVEDGDVPPEVEKAVTACQAKQK
jgi:hypothetical protein